MDASARAGVLSWIAQMQHLVKQDVFHRQSGSVDAVQYPAQHDRVVRRIVMSQKGSRSVRAPAQNGPRHQSMEVAEVQLFENLVQIVEDALGSLDALAAADLPHHIQTAPYVAAVEIAAIPQVALGRHRPPKKLREQYFGQRLHDGGGRSFQGIRQAD